jgi:hypothetical protein
MTLPSIGINVLAIWMTLLATGMTLPVTGKTLPPGTTFLAAGKILKQFEFI